MNSELGLTGWTTDIVSAYVAHNAISGEKLPELIGSVYAALSKSTIQGAEPPKEELKPAVPVKKSVTSEHIVCLEDGRSSNPSSGTCRAIMACRPKNTGRNGAWPAIIRWWLRPMRLPVRISPKPWDWAGLKLPPRLRRNRPRPRPKSPQRRQGANRMQRRGSFSAPCPHTPKCTLRYATAVPPFSAISVRLR